MTSCRRAPPRLPSLRRPAKSGGGASSFGCWFAAAALAVAAALGSLLWRTSPLLVWNASSSSRIGLYLVSSSASPGRGEMVVAWPPPAARRLAAVRGYLPDGVPLVKTVAGVGGDRVCAAGPRIFIDGRPAAIRRSSDALARPMPWWSGCRRLARHELFLLSPRAPLAFDGRYFGVTRASELVGRARLLWPRPARGFRHD
jgi:conjugative transfer signal peptidase TraF